MCSPYLVVFLAAVLLSFVTWICMCSECKKAYQRKYKWTLDGRDTMNTLFIFLFLFIVDIFFLIFKVK